MSKRLKSMGVLDWIAISLLIIGGINWGLMGLFSFNLVSVIFGGIPYATMVIYVLVGAAAIYSIYSFIKLLAK